MFSILRVQHFLKVRTCSLLFLSRSSCICWISRSDLLFRTISALLFFDGFFVILRLLVLKKLSRINFLKTKKGYFCHKNSEKFLKKCFENIFFSKLQLLSVLSVGWALTFQNKSRYDLDSIFFISTSSWNTRESRSFSDFLRAVLIFEICRWLSRNVVSIIHQHFFVIWLVKSG